MKATYSESALRKLCDESIIGSNPKLYPINWKKHDKRAKLVNLLNVDFDTLPFVEKIDDISKSCYEHWLASSDDAMELNPVINNKRLIIGPFDRPLASDSCIYATQIDGGSVFKGLYRIKDNIIMCRNTLQISKASKDCKFTELAGTTYLSRFFRKSEDGWEIDPLGVYYQLKHYGGIKRARFAVVDTGTQTELSGEKLDELLNERTPEG
jgi:hypothetical protein